jgi:hypothetical protein
VNSSHNCNRKPEPEVKRRFRLVRPGDDVSVFDNLDGLRHAQKQSVLHHRQRLTETFARIPHDRALALYRHIGGPAWLLLIELDRLILAGRGRNPVKLTNKRLASIGVTHHTRARALRQLEAAGVITVEYQGPGQSPLVRHLWFPVT